MSMRNNVFLYLFSVFLSAAGSPCAWPVVLFTVSAVLLCLLDACVGFVLDKSWQNKDETKGRTTSEVNSGLAIFMQGNITFSAKHRQSWKQMLPILVGFDSRV